jgi:hypothetical protein
MDDVIVKYAKHNLGNIIEDYYVENIVFSNKEPSITIEKLKEKELDEYILYVKRFLGVKENASALNARNTNCISSESDADADADEPGKFRLQSLFDLSEQIHCIFCGYEEMQVFRENIELWECAIEFIEFMPNIIKDFCKKKNLYYYIVAAIQIVHKYHIDDSYENTDIADFFGLDIKKLNSIEFKIFKKMNHYLPFINLYKYKTNADLTDIFKSTINGCSNRLDLNVHSDENSKETIEWGLQSNPQSSLDASFELKKEKYENKYKNKYENKYENKKKQLKMGKSEGRASVAHTIKNGITKIKKKITASRISSAEETLKNKKKLSK